MIKLYHSPLSRSVRICWLLEELGIPYELETLELTDPSSRPFSQKTPFGKIPVIEDGDVVMFESGAIVEYILERYGEGRLAPALDSSLRGTFLQWIHFAESTGFTGLGNIIWHTRFKQDVDSVAGALDDYRVWASAALDALERGLAANDYLLGSEFSGADIMVGYTLLVAKSLGVLGEDHPGLDAYLARLTERPAFRKALQT